MIEEHNRLVTRTGKGTDCGQLLRHYWQPVALADELKPPRQIRPARVLGQDLVLFRDEQGRLGLVDRDCPHRGADLAFGRLEDGGLRCLFHGWLFDVTGKCLETPAEPAGSTFCDRVSIRSYPVCERSGIVFGYLGEGEPPEFPALDCFVASDSHVFAFKGLFECNWLQALEVGIDPAHASFLHRFFEDEDASGSYGRQFRAESANSDMPMTQVLREFPCPEITVEKSDTGLRLTALRRISDTQTHVRVTNLLFPQAFVIPMSSTMTITQWHVPVDDENCYWYAIFTSFTDAIDKPSMRAQREKLYTLPDYRPRVGRHNDYGYDWDEQQFATYTGMGDDINVHDQWAVESQGRIQDRTREHLGTTDKGIVAYRKMLLSQIRKAVAGTPVFPDTDAGPADTVRGPATIDVVGPTQGWQDFWVEADRARRSGAQWATPQTLASD